MDDLSAFPLRDNDGNIVGIIEYVKDITNQKKTEMALQQSEERYRSLVENTLDGYFICEMPSGSFLFLNQRICDLFGYTMKEGLGLTLWDVVAPKEHQLIEDRLKIRMEGKEEINFSSNIYESVTKDGSTLSTEVSTSMVTYQGKPVIQGTLRDITETERLRFHLQQAQKMESIGTLAGGIAHDFNNILSPIMLHSEMALMALPTDSPLRDSLQHILQAGERARDLVKQILTFARQRKEDRVKIKASTHIEEVIKFLRSTIPTTIDFHYDFRAEQDLVLADPTQLNQIVINLCTNAAHAMEEKGGILEVILEDRTIDHKSSAEFTGIDPGRYVKLTVLDTGHGIEPQLLDKVFEPYFTTKEVGKGTGMGLALVHSIVESYGGAITVQSEVGTGTSFHVYFPLIENKSEIIETIEDGRQLPRGTEGILLVDDEKANVYALQTMLETLGYKVTARTSSVEALEAFREGYEDFDLVITDMTMPNMTGKDLAKQIMSIRSNIPIILCSGFSERIDDQSAKAMRIKAFIMKPISMHDIANIIREVLDKE